MFRPSTADSDLAAPALYERELNGGWMHAAGQTGLTLNKQLDSDSDSDSQIYEP